jgi:hypothetical protein
MKNTTGRPTLAIISLNTQQSLPVQPEPRTRAWLSPERAAEELFGAGERKAGAATIRALLRAGTLKGGKLGQRWVIEATELEVLRERIKTDGFVSTRAPKTKRRNAARA